VEYVPVAIRPRPKPKNALCDVKALVKAGHVVVNPDVLQDAYDDFGWWDTEIKQCLLLLNDRYFYDNEQSNHYYNSKTHDRYPKEVTFIDYYRAHKIMQNESIYTHIYIRENTATLTVNSFKEL
jgi:hypothetical protein